MSGPGETAANALHCNTGGGMARTNLIVNGTFDAQSSGWSGTDIEAYHDEFRYLDNSSNNNVAEMYGHAGQTTVMEQSFTVANPMATELTLDVALRTLAADQAGSDGFTVEILDSDGVAIAQTTITPETHTLENFSVPVDFPSAGTYTLRFTEVGNDDSLGAIIDNVELMVCFASETLIETADGARQAGTIRVGDLVQTSRGPRPVRWVGVRRVSAAEMEQNQAFCPVRICQGALGAGLPARDLRVSRQHRMMLNSPVAGRMFGQDEVLVPAVKLTTMPGIFLEDAPQDIQYVHIMFDEHEVIYAEGAPSESLLLAAESWTSLSAEAREELRLMFPDRVERLGWTSAKPIPCHKLQNTLLARIQKNKRRLLEGYSREIT